MPPSRISANVTPSMLEEALGPMLKVPSRESVDMTPSMLAEAHAATSEVDDRSRVSASVTSSQLEQVGAAGVPVNAQSLRQARSKASRASNASSRASGVEGWRKQVKEVPIVPGRNVPSHVSRNFSQRQAESRPIGSVITSRNSSRSQHGPASQHTSALPPIQEHEEMVLPPPVEAEAPLESVQIVPPPSHHSGRSGHSRQHDQDPVVEAGEQAVSEINSAHESKKSSNKGAKAPSQRPSHRGNGQSSNHPRSHIELSQPLVRIEPGGRFLGEMQFRGDRYQPRAGKIHIQQLDRMVDEDGTVYSERREVRVRDQQGLRNIPKRRRPRWLR